MAGRPAGIAALDRAWDAVFDHVRLEVEKDTLQLTGRMMRPDLRQNAQPIPSVWGRALDFDLRAGTIFMQDQMFVGVEVSKQLPFGVIPDVGSDEPCNRTGPPVAKNEAPPAASEPRGPITPHTAANLTDDEVFALLDEYARRVVEDEDSSLKLPVKVSFMPILRRRLRWRFESGENAPTLAADAAALEKWIKTKVDGHQTPSAKHIENELREEHRRLKAQHPRPASKDRQS
ncbi:hypothetical protein [Roseomonas rosulenta]|uniref:hypothetical protein n=1 Tax=Roseomonas rosulenta TaxID=2748667 RepID=UPI0018DF4B7F|nr:hypothetical protein [Roseomonas rosulenta]